MNTARERLDTILDECRHSCYADEDLRIKVHREVTLPIQEVMNRVMLLQGSLYIRLSGNQ